MHAEQPQRDVALLLDWVDRCLAGHARPPHPSAQQRALYAWAFS